jgi:hypothetical protein
MLKMLGIVGNKGKTTGFAKSGGQNVRILNALFLLSEFYVNLSGNIKKRVIQLPHSQDIAKRGKFLKPSGSLNSHKTPPHFIVSDRAELYGITGSKFIMDLLNDLFVLPKVKRDNI